ncbi:hypothetical protein HDU86_004801 [Geranomyces michiganensis]|nr:hypothetical protein HDU86_004801 [Geranomyces michiganensis]
MAASNPAHVRPLPHARPQITAGILALESITEDDAAILAGTFAGLPNHLQDHLVTTHNILEDYKFAVDAVFGQDASEDDATTNEEEEGDDVIASEEEQGDDAITSKVSRPSEPIGPGPQGPPRPLLGQFKFAIHAVLDQEKDEEALPCLACESEMRRVMRQSNALDRDDHPRIDRTKAKGRQQCGLKRWIKLADLKRAGQKLLNNDARDYRIGCQALEQDLILDCDVGGVHAAHVPCLGSQVHRGSPVCRLKDQRFHNWLRRVYFP